MTAPGGERRQSRQQAQTVTATTASCSESLRRVAARRLPDQWLGYTRRIFGDSMYASVQLLSASRQNLRLLILIRVLVLAAQAGAVGLAYATQALTLPWVALGITLAISGLLCLGAALRLRGPWPVTELEYAVHLGFDLLIHSALLYYSGGSTNPFVSYYLVPLTIAAATLPWLYTLVLAGLALAGYTLMLVWYDPITLPPVERATLLVYGMWLSFALAAALITF